jgi:cytoskeletal protein CcmA (bactofilin family)
MGLFGRDDRATPPPSAAPPAAPTRPPVKPQAPGQARADELTVVGRGTRVEGKLTAKNDVQIEGEVKGTVEGAGQVLVAEGSRLEAALHARVLVVAGAVIGDVSADDKIELRPSANLRGNVTAPRVVIQDGATFEGQVFMQKPEARTAQPATSTDAGAPPAAPPPADSRAESSSGEQRPGKPKR